MKRILLIEDEDALRDVLRTLLEDEGYVVEDARNGLAGVELAITFMPDVVVSDIRMPGIDGFEVARRLRRDLRLQHVRLVAYTSSDVDQVARSAGFDFRSPLRLRKSWMQSKRARHAECITPAGLRAVPPR